MQERPFVSVIIPVFNDVDGLKRCLAALTSQTYERSHYEIVVVDNGSADLDSVKAVVNAHDGVVFAVELTPGSYAARNKGITLARGEAIAFTDADCIPHSDWLERGLDRLTGVDSCGQVAGKVTLFFAEPNHPTAVELYESITAFPQERLLREAHGGATANVFTWRRVLDQVGHFNAEFKSNGDLEWGQRVFQAGYRQVYAADAEVNHPARRSIKELNSRTRRLAGGSYDFQLSRTESMWQRQIAFARLLLYHFMPPVFFTVNTCFDARLNGIGQKLKVVSVMVLVRYISAREIIRLKAGGLPSRA